MMKFTLDLTAILALMLLISACSASKPGTPVGTVATVADTVTPASAASAPATISVTPTTSTQSGGSFTFETVHLTLDPALASGASGQVIPEKAAAPDGPYWDAHPRTIRIELQGYPVTQSAHQPVIEVYPIADYRRVSEPAGKTIDALIQFLNEDVPDAPQIPALPVVNAGQVFHSNVRRMPFQNGSGVRFLAIYGQYPAPVNNTDLFYSFQGLTGDGQYWISVTLPITHPSLIASPNALSQTEYEKTVLNPQYYPSMASQLNAQPADSFTPDLGKLDALVGSIRIGK